MILPVLDPRSARPLYEQIVEEVRAALDRGELRAGDRLPSIRDLSTLLRINRNTVAQAYRLLKDLGLIETNGPKGAFVSGPDRADEPVSADLDRWVADQLARGRGAAELSDLLAAKARELGPPPNGEPAS